MNRPTSCKRCGVTFDAWPDGHRGRPFRYCEEHRTVRDRVIVSEAAATQVNNRKRRVKRRCRQCRLVLDESIPQQQRYCSPECKQLAATDRRRAAANELRTQSSRKVYERLTKEGYAEAIYRKEMTATQVATILDVTTAAVSKAMGAYRTELKRQADAEEWERNPEVTALLPTGEIAALQSLGLEHEGTPLYEWLIDIIAEAFWKFEHRYFTIGSRQGAFIRKPFHSEIIREFIVAYVFAQRVLVLTPPRHGKSELVIRFCGWLIVMFPNIQILWVAANTDLAGQMTRKLKATFQYNLDLRNDMLPPGHRFGDESAPKWTENEFTLFTRTDPTLKSPTFTGLGSTSTVAGRDADFIGVDDLEERKTVATSDLRAKSREKHAEIMERQEDHTGVVTIGSRQHIDDIPNHLKSEEGEEAWRILEYSAHDETACDVDPEELVGHDDCVLMPEIRDYRWLMRQRRETQALGLPGRYELRYLQKAIPIEGIIFEIPTIREKCLDRSRVCGLETLPAGRLIAGLDPAARGMQAAFCWLWTPTATYMVDLETQQAGGFEGALDIMRRWHNQYNLDTWIYEDNSQQIEFFRDPRLTTLKTDLQLTVLPHTTGTNKHDPELGLTAMAPWYHSGRMNLPYGNEDARYKVNQLLRQLELWTTDGYAKKGKSDIKMASWFPFPRMQRWQKGEVRQTVALEDDGGIGWDYATLGGFDTLNEEPW